MDAESNEFYTPQYIREALPELDLDPCASPWSRVVAARKIVGLNGEDGLKVDWGPVYRTHGRFRTRTSATVFCNPPYGRDGSTSLLAMWLAKCRVEWESRRADPVIALVPVRTAEAYWTGNVWGSALLIGFIKGRVCFEGPSGHKTDEGGKFSSCFVVYASSARLPAVQHLIQRSQSWVHWTSVEALKAAAEEGLL